MLGKTEGKRRRGNTGWDGRIDSMDVSVGKLLKTVRDRGTSRAAVHGVERAGHDWATEQQQEWKTRNLWFVVNHSTSLGPELLSLYHPASVGLSHLKNYLCICYTTKPRHMSKIDLKIILTNASLFMRIVLVTCCSCGGFWVTFCLPWEGEDCIAHGEDNTRAETQS